MEARQMNDSGLFRKELIGNFEGPRCETKSSDRKHECGDPATHFFMLSEEPVFICGKCLTAANAGAFGKRIREAAQSALTTDHPIPRKRKA